MVFRVFGLQSSSCDLSLYYQCFIAFLSITVTAEAGCLPVFSFLTCEIYSPASLICVSYWPWCWFVRLIRKIEKLQKKKGGATVCLVRPSVRLEQLGPSNGRILIKFDISVFSKICRENSNYNGLLTVHSDTIKVLFANLMHNFFIKSIVFLYMFRALLCSSSGGLNCIYASSGS